jgi:hypothetical protein
MNATLEAGNGSAPDHPGKATTASERQASLQRALHTLRAIWQRYEIERAGNSDLRARVVHVALGHSDMCWITAAIGALEEALTAAAKVPGKPQR